MNKKAALGRMIPEAAYFDVFENNGWKNEVLKTTVHGIVYIN